MSQVIAGGRWIVKKKPIEVEAMLYNGENGQEVVDWVVNARQYHTGGIRDTVQLAPNALAIFTLEGRMEASPGDWIIKGVKGEYYPCKPDIFAETYELVALVVDRNLEISNGIEDNPPRIPPGHPFELMNG